MASGGMRVPMGEVNFLRTNLPMQGALFAQYPFQGSLSFTKLPLFYEILLVFMTARNLRMR